MATTLTYGLVKPVTGDTGAVWFPAMEANITQLDAHDHNGTNSPQLSNTGIATAAAITRSKLATGTAYRVLANTSAGVISENAALTAAHVIYADANGQLAGEAALAITRGGTGQATATLAFNALSPTTTTGDIMYHNGTDDVRLAKGSDGQVLTLSAGFPSWQTNTTLNDQSYEITNLTLTATVAASALTVALKTKAGTDPAGGDVVKIGFRSATAATGTYVQRSVSAALSVVVSSGSTLGHASGTNAYIYVYAIDNAGTVELAVSSQLFDEGTRQSTTAEGGAGASDASTVIYSTTARTTIGIRLIGRLLSNQTVAGTWDVAISEISLPPFSKATTPALVIASSKTAAYTAIPTDHFIPCNASGASFTLTLPPAATLSGHILHIKKTDSDFTKVVTIDGNASETIDGATTTTLNTQYEAIRIISDGSNWHIIRHWILLNTQKCPAV